MKLVLFSFPLMLFILMKLEEAGATPTQMTVASIVLGLILLCVGLVVLPRRRSES